MKLRLVVAAQATILMSAFVTHAQTTASGAMTVSATVQGSLKLAFNSDASGLTLTGAGSNSATLPFGTVMAYGGSLPSTITRAVSSDNTTFTISTPIDVYVFKANVSSSNFTLTAQINTADSVNTWTVNNVAVTNGSAVAVTSTGSYATNVSMPVALTVPFSNNTGSVSNTINFTVTTN
jgi:hypothetical protein